MRRFGLALLLIAAFFVLTAESPSPWEVEGLVGMPAAPFSLKDMQGADISLSTLKGKPVLITFWATWCPPCRDELPSLEALSRTLKKEDLVVLTIATDKSLGAVKKFLARNRFDLTVLYDTDMRVARQYKVFSMPTTFLVDRRGIIVKRYLGEEEWGTKTIQDEIRRLAIAK